MIIRPHRDSLLFITQPDHAVLAADLADRFAALDARPRGDEIRLAVREHDNGWRELDEDLVYDPATGSACDFVAVAEPLKQSVWPLGIDRLAAQSTYAAALVAAHAVFVYSGNRDRPEWQLFFANQESRRDDLIARARVPLADLERDYAFLAIADLMSLSFCHGWAETKERFSHTVRCEDAMLVVTPALIPETPVAIRVRARRVPDRRYASADELRRALAAAPVEWLAGQACGRPA